MGLKIKFELHPNDGYQIGDTFISADKVLRAVAEAAVPAKGVDKRSLFAKSALLEALAIIVRAEIQSEGVEEDGEATP